MTSLKAACATGGTHPGPPHLISSFPPLEAHPALAQAMRAAWDGCQPCTRRQPEVTEALFVLWLMWMTIVRFHLDLPTVDTADALLPALLEGAPAGAEAQPSDATLRVLKGLPMDAVPGPKGGTVNIWQGARLTALIDSLSPQEADDVWEDCLAFLLGVLRGEGRAISESN